MAELTPTGGVFTATQLRPTVGSGVRPTTSVPATFDTLHGRPDASVCGRELKYEQPWHKQAAFLFASGMTAKAVAEACDRSYPTVLNLLKQRWFQGNLTQIVKENGGSDLLAMFRAEGLASLATLVELRDTAKNENVKRACATEIIDRILGKPMQHVEQSTTVRSDNPEQEVAQLEAERQRLLGNAPAGCAESEDSLSPYSFG